jgi:hypothetical protein
MDCIDTHILGADTGCPNASCEKKNPSKDQLVLLLGDFLSKNIQ